MKFYYPKLPTRNGKFVELPLVDVIFSFGRYFCLVDSGAEFCYFHGKIGELLGLKVTEGREIESQGITADKFTAYLHYVRFKIGGWDHEMEVAFSYDLGTPFGILGREGFFNLFKVCFSHSQKEIELKPIHDLTKRGFKKEHEM